MLDPNIEYDMSYNGKFWVCILAIYCCFYANNKQALSPLISTMPHLAHTRLDSSRHEPVFPPAQALADKLESIHLAHTPRPSSDLPEEPKPASSLSAITGALKSSMSTGTTSAPDLGTKGPHSLDLHGAQERKSYFSTADHRREVTFGPEVCFPTPFVKAYKADTSSFRTSLH